jgi:hypothetical protein
MNKVLISQTNRRYLNYSKYDVMLIKGINCNFCSIFALFNTATSPYDLRTLIGDEKG